MKKTTSPKLVKTLTKYGALAIAISNLPDVHGQSIDYTNIADFIGGVDSEYYLDLNDDSYIDFRIINRDSPYNNTGSNNLYIEPWSIGNSVLGSALGIARAYPWALSSGFTISSGNSSGNVSGAFWRNWGYDYYSWNSLNYGDCDAGLWCNVEGYIGLRFDIDGSGIHYGWVRLQVDQNSNTYTIKDYAYHTTPGASIEAGQTTLSIENEALNNTRIVTLNKTIAIYNINERADYTLFNISGQSVLKGKIDLGSNVIEANTLTSGVYIIELQDQNTNAVLRKKIVL